MVAPARATPWYAACTIAFCSACRQRHASSPVPAGASERHREHPPSPQFRRPRGVSLYPVLSTMRSLTMTAPTWRRTQVDRVAARCARFMKYSSHEGRAMILLGPVEPVARVSQAGDDVPVVVEPLVHGGRVDVHIGVGLLHPTDPLGGGDEDEETDPPGGLGFYEGDGLHRRSPCGQHGIHHQRLASADVGGELAVVGVRSEGGGI